MKGDIAADIAIVGAGAAGCAAAATVAPQASTILIDRIAEPRWRIGETLPGAARRPLAAIGAWDRFTAAAHGGAPVKTSRWGSDDIQTLDAMRDPDGAGWRIDRACFESDLRVTACERGARMLAPASVSHIAREDGLWRLTLGDGNTVHARIVIQASGRRSRLMEPFGQRRQSLDRLVCIHQCVRQSEASDPSTYTQSTPAGWWYTAPLPGGSRIVAFHTDADLPHARVVREETPLAAACVIEGLSDAIGKTAADDVGETHICAAGSAVGSAAGAGWLAAGDSVIALDPLSSQGLFNALVTGLETGEAALSMLDGDRDAATGHAARIGTIWRAYLAHRNHYYGMERRWSDAGFWARRVGVD